MPLAAFTAVLVALALAWPAPAAAREADVGAYHGLAAWIDIFDAEPWERPARTLRAMARRGVRTVFVQTSNFRQPRAVHRPRALARMLGTAHRRGMRVVAWYLPGFADPARDWRRTKAAVRFRGGGHRFDGFALDIEATAVLDIALRNRRLLRLSGRLRRLVGGRYALGAIIPDPVSQRYWPAFPYRAVRARYDAFLPMSYWTAAAARGQALVRRRTCETLRIIRARTRDRSVPVHVVGGIASHASTGEVRGFARAAVACGATGASLYDAPITSARQWRELARIGRFEPER